MPQAFKSVIAVTVKTDSDVDTGPSAGRARERGTGAGIATARFPNSCCFSPTVPPPRARPNLKGRSESAGRGPGDTQALTAVYPAPVIQIRLYFRHIQCLTPARGRRGPQPWSSSSQVQILSRRCRRRLSKHITVC